MKTCLLIGAKGFIGAALAAAARARGYALTAIDRDNYAQSQGAQADLLINAAGNSRKFLDDQDPLQGFELSVSSVMRSLHDFKFNFYIQLSSGAIYPDEGNPANNAESSLLDPAAMTRYGFHKWLAEQLVRRYAPEHLIVRLGGLLGPGLKKNAVFDILHGGPLYVHPDSQFQYMDTRDLAEAIFDLYAKAAGKVQLLNLSARGVVSVRQMAGWAKLKLSEETFSRALVRAELNLNQAAQLIELPPTDITVQKFIAAARRGAIGQ